MKKKATMTMAERQNPFSQEQPKHVIQTSPQSLHYTGCMCVVHIFYNG